MGLGFLGFVVVVHEEVRFILKKNLDRKKYELWTVREGPFGSNLDPFLCYVRENLTANDLTSFFFLLLI